MFIIRLLVLLNINVVWHINYINLDISAHKEIIITTIISLSIMCIGVLIVDYYWSLKLFAFWGNNYMLIE